MVYVVLQGKKRKDTVCIALADDTCEEVSTVWLLQTLRFSVRGNL